MIFTLAFPILKSILIKSSELTWAWLLSTNSTILNLNSCFLPFFYFLIFEKYILSFLLIIIKCRQPKILVPSEGSMRDWHTVVFQILVINIWYPFIVQSWLCIHNIFVCSLSTCAFHLRATFIWIIRISSMTFFRLSSTTF